jgi:GNAT superfamily N-acetyltransferase
MIFVYTSVINVGIYMQKAVIKDKMGNQIVIEFETVDLLSPQFAEKLKGISGFLSKAYVPVEAQFARKFPKELSQDRFLVSLEPLFKEGIDNVNWEQVEVSIENTLKHFFGEIFAKSMSSHKDMTSKYTHFLIVAKENKQHIGALYGMMNTTDGENNVRIPFFGVSPEAQSKGVGKMLMNSVKNFIPNCKKISLSTRVTNERAIGAYCKWGFVSSPNTMPHWANLEYSVENT